MTGQMISEWINTIIQGVLLGGLYALFAAGLSLIFGIMRLVNLAHGDLIVLAAFAILAMSAWLLIWLVEERRAGSAGEGTVAVARTGGRWVGVHRLASLR